VVGYIILVQQFGIKAAAVTRLMAGIVYLFIMIFYYKKFIMAASFKRP